MDVLERRDGGPVQLTVAAWYRLIEIKIKIKIKRITVKYNINNGFLT
jgi:hypothetical protein